MRLSSFRTGYHPQKDALLPIAASGATPYARNVLVDRDSIRTRPPRYTMRLLPNNGDPGRAIFPYVNRKSDPFARFVLASGTHLYASDAEDNVFTSALGTDTFITLDTTIHATNRISATQFQRALWFCDGDGYAKRWAGDSEIGSIVQFTGDGPGPTITEASRYTDNTEGIYTITITTAGFRDDIDDPDAVVAKFSWQRQGSGVHSGVSIAEEVALEHGITLKWEQTDYTKDDSWKFRATPADYVLELKDGDAPSYLPVVETAPDIGVADCKTGSLIGYGQAIGETISGTADTWRARLLPDVDDFNGTTLDFRNTGTSYAACARLMQENANHLTGDGAVALELLTADAFTYQWGQLVQHLDQPLDLSRDDTIAIRYKLVNTVTSLDHTPVTESRLFVEFGSKASDDHFEMIVEADISGYGQNSWQVVEVDISDLPSDQRANINYVALSFANEAYSTGLPYTTKKAREEYDGPGDDVYAAAIYSEAFTLIVDRIATVNSVPRFPAGEYRFLYTIGRFDGVQWVESPESPIVTKTVLDDHVGVFKVTCHFDNPDATIGEDRLYIYALGGPLATWRRIAEHDIDPKTDEYLTVWNGRTDGLLEGFMPYVKAPPKGCSHVLPYRDRIIWIKDDKLYLSNTGEGGKVVQKAMEQAYDFYGGTAVVGDDGYPITAGAFYNGAAYLFKENGIWRFSGDTMREGFLLEPVTREFGTTQPDTVALMGQAAMVWVDTGLDTLFMSPSGEIDVLGKDDAGRSPVREFASSAVDAYATVDQSALRYYVMFPGGVMIFDGKTGAWQPLQTGHPFGPLCYHPQCAYPGVYLASAFTAHNNELLLLGQEETLLPTFAHDEATIACAWRSFSLADGSLRYLDPRWVRAQVANTTEGNITLKAFFDGALTAEVTQAVTVSAFQTLEWELDGRDGTLHPQLELAWAANAGDTTEVMFVDVQLADRGGRYG